MMGGLDYDDLQEALEHLDLDSDDGETSDPASEFSDDSPSGEDTDDDKEDNDEEDGDDIDVSVQFPERLPLILPSSFNSHQVVLANLQALAFQELELRKGQANDCLERLRLNLGHQALLYRTNVRNASSTKQKLRAFHDVKACRKKVEVCVRTYRRARRSLQRLGADSATMDKYKPILRSDLRLSGDITQENRLGQRNDTLAWFWTPGEGGLDNSHSLMDECESFISSGSHLLIPLQSFESTGSEQKHVLRGGMKS
jgi:hypothetical protein